MLMAESTPSAAADKPAAISDTTSWSRRSGSTTCARTSGAAPLQTQTATLAPTSCQRTRGTTWWWTPTWCCTRWPLAAAVICAVSQGLLRLRCNAQMDFLEHTGVDDVIIMSVVLQEAKAKNVSSYNRLRALTSAPDRRFYVFSNENHQYVWW